MIFEHQHFSFNCVPKTGSKTTSAWCEANGLIEVNILNQKKPVFATMRDHKDRIISGIFEDIFHLTLTKFNITGLEPFDDIKHLYENTINNWLLNYTKKVLPSECHYAKLESYFLTSKRIDMSTVHWIHMDDILIIDQLINKTLGFDLKLTPVVPENFIFDNRRPPKEWFFEIIKENSQVLSWINNLADRDYTPTYIKL